MARQKGGEGALEGAPEAAFEGPSEGSSEGSSEGGTGWRYGLYGLLGSAVSTAVAYGPGLRRDATVPTPALDAISAPFGGHASTWPFVLTTMLFLAAVPTIPRLRRV
ncbi:hypothetical protein ABZW30_09890 [Kitasatospora sp. NPDC004669]|uniref:hypothetical protein n=1 Tax=Kitasatospora sp. NPDC004669 TaxID=3154555 RepID=UPI0033BC97E1